MKKTKVVQWVYSPGIVVKDCHVLYNIWLLYALKFHWSSVLCFLASLYMPLSSNDINICRCYMITSHFVPEMKDDNIWVIHSSIFELLQCNPLIYIKTKQIYCCCDNPLAKISCACINGCLGKNSGNTHTTIPDNLRSIIFSFKENK